MKLKNENLRNIAIIAHVDHGKTTMVNSMYIQGAAIRENFTVEDRVMDNMELEKERGITIAAKNCAVFWNNIRINIIDTPGHADFGGEVERALSMVDGAVLLVDGFEGPLPQTRFVLKKALEKNIKIIVAINKIDRKEARPQEVLNEIIDLFIDLNATDEQLEFPVIYTIGKLGVAKRNIEDSDETLLALFETIRDVIPAPSVIDHDGFSMLVSDLGYSDYLGRLAVGRIHSGNVKIGDQVIVVNDDQKKSARITKLQVYDGLALVDAKEASAGEIIVIAGIEGVNIGSTITSSVNPLILPSIHIDEPTVSMRFGPNTAPTAGKEGKIVQSSRIKERLEKEMLRNVAIQIEKVADESFIVKGRGEFQLAIIIETMRREGFELSVGRPEVIYKKDGSKVLEPIEHVHIDCEEDFLGVVTEKLSLRKGIITNLVNNGSGRVRVEFDIPSRGLIGYRDSFLTDTKGTGIMNSLFKGYEEYKGDFPVRYSGSLVADRSGTAVGYALFHLEPRGRLIVVPGDTVYEGMVIGEHNKDSDLDVNPCKEKKQSNVRTAGKDENIILRPVRPITLEEAINFLAEDEQIEVTPKSLRIRKNILDGHQRQVIRNRSEKSK